MAYIEETVDKLREAVTDFKVEVADRLGRIETEQNTTNEQLRKINGSVQKSADRLNILESQDRSVDKDIAALKLNDEKHGNAIAKIELDWATVRGKVAGFSLLISGAGYGLMWLTNLAIQWYRHKP